MADEERTTGTPTQEGGDAAKEPTAGTPESEGRDAVATEPDWKQIALANKNTVEQANRVLERLQAESPRATSPAGSEEFNPAAYEAYLKGLAANATDPGAQLWVQKELRSLQETERIKSENQYMQQVLGVFVQNPPDDARMILKELQANPQKYGSIDDVQRAIDLKKKQAEITNLQQEVKRLQNQSAVSTAGRETQSVPEFKKEMTGSEWNKRQASLPQAQKYAEQAKLRNGEIKVNW